MKVYVKKSDKNSKILGIIITIMFLSFSIWIFASGIRSGKSLVDMLAIYGDKLLFAIIFFALGVFFLYILLKRPKGYKAKLINKKAETYKGKQITYMKFVTEKESKQEEDFISDKYKCYTIGENNLVVGKYYILKIKEFNWEPKSIIEIKDSNKNKVATKVPNSNLTLVYLAVGFVFGGDIFLCILGIIMYPQYAFTYILVGVFSGAALYSLLKRIKP